MKEFTNAVKGMITDVELINQEQGSYIFALNAILESDTGDGLVLQNDYSNLLGTVLDTNENVIGKLYISELDILILYTTNNRILSLSSKLYNDGALNSYDYINGSIPITPENNINILDTKVIASSDCFNWDINHKLNSKYKITDKTLNLYFVDGGYNEDRYIYLDKETLEVDNSFKRIIGWDGFNNPIYSEEIDCNNLKWYPEISFPDITTSDTEGGNLQAGVYQFSVAYSTSKSIELTGYKAMTNPFHLFTKTLTDVTDYNTGRAIEIEIDNLNTTGRYRYINIAVLKTVNGVSVYNLVTTLQITGEKLIYTYTGDRAAVTLDESRIFQLFPFYKSSKGLAIANNKLFKYAVKEFEKFNLQPIVNRMKLKWFTITAKEGDYASPEFAQNYRSYLRDEVYIFGIKFILDNSEETQVFPFIGRASTLSDIRIITNADAVKPEDCESDGLEFKQRWQVYNTARVEKTNEENYNKCNYKQYQEGEFAFFASTETYPNDVNVWGELAGKQMLLHKLPDCAISQIHNGGGDSKLNYEDDNYIYPLGVKLSDDTNIEELLLEAVNMSLITQQQKERIRGYKIIRGNRTGNKSIIAKGWVSDVWAYNDKGKTVFYPNHGFNDLRRDPYLLNQDLKTFAANEGTREPSKAEFFEDAKYTFHSPDTSFTQPSLGTIFKIENEIYGSAKGWFSESKGQGRYVILSQLHYNFAIAISWFMTSRLELSKSVPSQQGQSIGSGVGAVVGGIVGGAIGGVGAPLGSVIGSGLGGIIGKLVGGNTADDEYNHMYRNAMWLSQTDRILELLNNTMPLQNYHHQHQAVGKYNNVEKVENNGFKQRRILHSAYLSPTRQLLPGDVRFNNNLRESSVYVELESSIGKTKNIDDSKYTSRIPGTDQCYDTNREILSNISSFYASIKREIVNQYGTIYNIDWMPVSNKVWKLDEKFTEFGGDTYIGRFAFKRSHNFFVNTAYNLPNSTDIYYEDLANIAYPMYFFNTRYTELDDPTSINMKVMSTIENAWPLVMALNNLENPQTITENVVTWTANEGVQNAIGKMFKQTLMNPYVTTRPGRYVVDCMSDDFFEKRDPESNKNPDGSYKDPNDYVIIPSTGGWWRDRLPYSDTGVERYVPNVILRFSGVRGKIYTYNHAIPYFICESDVNLDLRHATNPNEGDFYPHQNDLDYLFQEENISPKLDNTYNYNRTYSKQNLEENTIKTDVNFFKEKDKILYENRVVYSQDGAEVENSEFKDNYLYFKPLDSFDFTFNNGKLISVDSIENEQVLVRFENNTRIFNAFNEVKTDGTSLLLGSGNIFGLRPQEFSKTDLGYIGSQHSDMLNTEFGHIIVDSRRGNVFNIAPGGKGIEELCKDGMKNWMIENLPFNINKYFPNVDIDNTYNNIGIALSYDKRYRRFFLTKLDYIPLDKNIKYINRKFYLDNIEIDVRNNKYFCNKSFTISYSFYKKSWTSFHSFTPNYYIDGVDLFYTGLNGKSLGNSSLWIHNLTNKSFQTYYNKLAPFEIELSTKLSLQGSVLNNISYFLSTLRYHNKYDKSVVKNISFNKALVYNETQNSGVLELNLLDENKLIDAIKYPEKTSSHTKIALKRIEDIHSFNQFSDISENNNLPRFLNACNNVNKTLNLEAINYNNTRVNNNYIRGQKCFVKLINDKHSEYKFIFRGLVSDVTPSVI